MDCDRQGMCLAMCFFILLKQILRFIIFLYFLLLFFLMSLVVKVMNRKGEFVIPATQSTAMPGMPLFPTPEETTGLK